MRRMCKQSKPILDVSNVYCLQQFHFAAAAVAVVVVAAVVLLVLESPFPILNVFSEQKNHFNGAQACMIFSSHQVEKLGLMIVTEHH